MKIPIDTMSIVVSFMLGAWIVQVTYETCKNRIYSLIWSIVGIVAFALTFS